MDGDAFREHRKRAGLSQADLAVRLGLSRDYIGQMERGTASIAPRTAAAMQALAPPSQISPRQLTTTDPLERMVEKALLEAAIDFETDRGGGGRHNLDFYLPDQGVAIEVKQFHSPRIAEQMSRAPNVIALQGIESVRLFCDLISKGHKKRAPRPSAPAPSRLPSNGNGG